MPSLRHNLEVPPKYIEIEKTRSKFDMIPVCWNKQK